MAQGTLTVSDDLGQQLGVEGHNMASDTFACILVSNTVAAMAAFDDFADLTECANGGDYTTGGVTLAGVSYTEAGGVSTFDSTTNPSWTKAAGSPTDIRCAVVYNTSHAGTADIVCYIDMTTDGSTAVSMVTGNISVSWHASGICTVGK